MCPGINRYANYVPITDSRTKLLPICAVPRGQEADARSEDDPEKGKRANGEEPFAPLIPPRPVPFPLPRRPIPEVRTPMVSGWQIPDFRSQIFPVKDKATKLLKILASCLEEKADPWIEGLTD